MISLRRGRRRTARRQALLRRRSRSPAREGSGAHQPEPGRVFIPAPRHRPSTRTTVPPTRKPRNRRVDVPHGILVASEWSWRLLLIVVAAGVAAFLIVQLGVVIIPVMIATLVTALLVPVTSWLTRVGVPRGLAAGFTLIGLVLVVLGLLAMVGQQVAAGYSGLSRQVVRGLDQVRDWLVTGPLGLSESEIDRAFASLGRLVTTNQLTEGALRVGTTIGHVVAGMFVALFATYFLLYEGERIWLFLVRLFPRSAHERVDSSGRRGWSTLTSFVRATVLVAFVDAVGIMLVALVLGLPFAVPIGVLVFLASFVPIVGALLSGAVAVLVALVSQGLLVAVLMLGGVLLVQQLEAHILQPFLMGRFVRLHPLAILLSIGAGGYLAGIVGALFAVPIVAVVNSVVRHLSGDGSGANGRAGGGGKATPPPGRGLPIRSR